jgi:hypothetical protein
MASIKVWLNVEKLGGTICFPVRETLKGNVRYVCSTFENDEGENTGNYDVYCDRESDEYFAVIG